MAAPSVVRAEIDREIAVAARNLAIQEGIVDYSLARARVEAEPEKHLSRLVCDRIRYSRQHISDARAKFLASFNALKIWAEGQGLNFSEMVGEWQRTTGGGSALTRTSAEQQRDLDAGAAAYEQAQGITARRNAPIGRPAA